MQCYACGNDDVVVTIRPRNKAWGDEFPMCDACFGVFELALNIGSTGWEQSPDEDDEDDELFPCHSCEEMFREDELFHLESALSYPRYCLSCLVKLEVE